MRIFQSILFCVALAITAGCERDQNELLLVKPISPIDAEIVQDLVGLLGPNAELSISLTETGQSEESALNALVSGEADLAMVSNNMPFRSGISTVMPLYPTVLHVGYRGQREFESGIELFRGARIFAGPAGSASRLMFERFTSRSGLTPEEFTFVANPNDERPDVFVVFAPISPDRLAEYPDIRLFSSVSPDDIGKGSTIDAAILMNPQLRPFVIPVGTYGAATPEPVLTVAVDMLLVARSDLSESVVYDLVRELSRLRPALASQRPGLFQRLSDDFNTSNSTFVLHPGLIAYLDRNEPTVYERYSGVAEVVVTVIVALFSAIFAGVRIYHMRRKNRIDTFYTDVIAIRSAVGDSATDAERAEATQRIRALQNTAFEMLVDEKLSADESFRIFISLSNDALRDLGTTQTGPGASDN
jgi:TRAP-type uncharacterized transport system substrate-binding protein